MILKNLDLKKIFAAADGRALTDLRLFAEEAQWRSLELRDRISDFRQNRQVGLAAHAHAGSKARVFFTPNLDADHLVHALSGTLEVTTRPRPAEKTAPAENRSAFDDHARQTRERLNGIDAAARKILQSFLAHLAWGHVRYEERERKFEIRDATTHAVGDETESRVVVEWARPGTSARLQLHRRDFAASDPNRIAEWLAHPDLQQAFQRSIEPPPTWPVPRGPLRTAWSPLALGRTLLPLVRGFEADLVLGRKSWLAAAPECLDWKFRLTDRPRPGVDAEGTARAEMPLFTDGVPRAVASDREWAAPLGRASTGHGRRASHRAVPTVGLWNVHLEPTETCPNALDALESGVYIQDVGMLFSDTRVASAWLRVHDAYLVHQGILGERLEPFDLELNLVDFFGRLRTAGGPAPTIGHAIEKSNQTFLTELTLPTAVFDPIEIPGTVPTGYYW